MHIFADIALVLLGCKKLFCSLYKAASNDRERVVKDIYFFIIFYSALHPFQGYFSTHETSQSLGGETTGEPREKPPGTPAKIRFDSRFMYKVLLHMVCYCFAMSEA